MHLKIQKRSGRDYLSVVQNYRLNGKVKSKTIETIGYADSFGDEYADPIAHFRSYVEELNRADAALRQSIDFQFEADAQIDSSAAPPARLGTTIALGCLDALGVRDFFRERSSREAIPEHAGRVFEMLAAERMLHATSKRESWTARGSFPRSCDFSFAEVYEVLETFARLKQPLDTRLLHRWRRIGGQADLSRVFLICGSYAFPVDGGSERAGIAVALDQSGMPLGYHDAAGRFEPSSFRKAADELKGRLDAKRVVIVAGGLRELNPTMSELAQTGDGFVLYQRNLRQAPELSDWAENEDGYAELGPGVYMKWRTTTRVLPDGTNLPVKEVVLRGGGYATRFSHAVLVTSELDLNASAIVQLYRELWRQAEPFQPLEADFSSMPYPTSARDHIQAHFALCYTAFFALRMLRWKMGFAYNAADTADALMRMEGIHLQRNYYLFNYRNNVTDCIEKSLGLSCAQRLRTRQELRGIPGTVRDSFLESY